MENYYLLFSKLEEGNYLPGTILTTRIAFNGLLNYMKEEKAKKVLKLLEECEDELEYKEKLWAMW